MTILNLGNGVEIYYKDWGNKSDPAVVFCHGWPLNSDNWENQMFFLANNGYRVIAHDRRGHGRSSQPWHGNDMDTYADDLFELVKKLNLTEFMMVGHSHGGGEVARFIGRHGKHVTVKKAVLVGAVPPLMVKTKDNPEGTPLSVFDGFRKSMRENRAQFFMDVPSGPFFGFNRPNATVSKGLIDSWWQMGMMSSFKSSYDDIKAFSETDFTDDLKKMDMPVLILHGDDDQIVPIEASAHKSAKIAPNATLKVYKGGAHSLPNTSANEVNQDLLKFFQK